MPPLSSKFKKMVCKCDDDGHFGQKVENAAKSESRFQFWDRKP